MLAESTKHDFSPQHFQVREARSSHGRQLLSLLKGMNKISMPEDAITSSPESPRTTSPTPRATWRIPTPGSTKRRASSGATTPPFRLNSVPRQRSSMSMSMSSSSCASTPRAQWDLPRQRKAVTQFPTPPSSKAHRRITILDDPPTSPTSRPALELPNNGMRPRKNSCHSPAVFRACRASDKRSKASDLGTTINLDLDTDLHISTTTKSRSHSRLRAKLPPLYDPDPDELSLSQFSELTVEMPNTPRMKDCFSSSDEDEDEGKYAEGKYDSGWTGSAVVGISPTALKHARYRLSADEENMVRSIVSFQEGDKRSMEHRRRLWARTGYPCGCVPEAIAEDIKKRDYNPAKMQQQLDKIGGLSLSLSLGHDVTFVTPEADSDSESEDDLYMHNDGPLRRPESFEIRTKRASETRSHRIKSYHSEASAAPRRLSNGSRGSTADEHTLPDYLYSDYKVAGNNISPHGPEDGNMTSRHRKIESKFGNF